MIKFGLVTDAHYADGVTIGNRYCSVSVEKMRVALAVFAERAVDFVVNLGDLINGAAGDTAQATDHRNLSRMRAVFDQFGLTVHHLFGNHDIESLSKAEFMHLCGCQARESHYRSWDITLGGGGRCRLVILDAGFRLDGSEYSRGNYLWDDSFLPSQQLSWLQDQVSDRALDRVIVFVHQNIDVRLLRGTIDPHIIRNAAMIRAVLETAPAPVTVIQGHYHRGYFQRIAGVDYLTLRAMCEGPAPDWNAYAILSIDDDLTVAVEGFGVQQSYQLRL